MVEQIYGENVEIGQQLPVFSRKTDLMHWNRWAAIYDEFLYYHMDDERAIENGQPSSIGQGRIRVSYAHTLLRNWIGDEGLILKIDVQMRGINFKNDEIECVGRVTSKSKDSSGAWLIQIEIDIKNQEGRTISPGKATVMLPSTR
jgi:acyl dehydratase